MCGVCVAVWLCVGVAGVVACVCVGVCVAVCGCAVCECVRVWECVYVGVFGCGCV